MTERDVVCALLLVAVAMPTMLATLWFGQNKGENTMSAMKGLNVLQLCPAEMKVAVQEYINKRLGAYASEVSQVRVSPDGAFVVTLINNDTEKAQP